MEGPTNYTDEHAVSLETGCNQIDSFVPTTIRASHLERSGDIATMFNIAIKIGKKDNTAQQLALTRGVSTKYTLMTAGQADPQQAFESADVIQERVRLNNVVLIVEKDDQGRYRITRRIVGEEEDITTASQTTHVLLYNPDGLSTLAVNENNQYTTIDLPSPVAEHLIPMFIFYENYSDKIASMIKFRNRLREIEEKTIIDTASVNGIYTSFTDLQEPSTSFPIGKIVIKESNPHSYNYTLLCYGIGIEMELNSQFHVTIRPGIDNGTIDHFNLFCYDEEDNHLIIKLDLTGKILEVYNARREDKGYLSSRANWIQVDNNGIPYNIRVETGAGSSQDKHTITVCPQRALYPQATLEIPRTSLSGLFDV